MTKIDLRKSKSYLIAKSCPMLMRHAAALTTSASRGLCNEAKRCSTPPPVTTSLPKKSCYVTVQHPHYNYAIHTCCCWCYWESGWQVRDMRPPSLPSFLLPAAKWLGEFPLNKHKINEYARLVLSYAWEHGATKSHGMDLITLAMCRRIGKKEMASWYQAKSGCSMTSRPHRQLILTGTQYPLMPFYN